MSRWHGIAVAGIPAQRKLRMPGCPRRGTGPTSCAALL
jgi:hypothetical protein